MRREVAGDLRAIFESGDRREAERRLQQAVDKYAQRAPKLSAWTGRRDGSATGKDLGPIVAEGVTQTRCQSRQS
jgi:hypothetical protein